MYPENPKGSQVIVGSMNMGYISDTARNRTHNLFRPRREPIPLGHSDGQTIYTYSSHQNIWLHTGARVNVVLLTYLTDTVIFQDGCQQGRRQEF